MWTVLVSLNHTKLTQLPALILRPLPLVSVAAVRCLLLISSFPHFDSSVCAGTLHADNCYVRPSFNIRGPVQPDPYQPCLSSLLSTQVFFPMAMLTMGTATNCTCFLGHSPDT